MSEIKRLIAEIKSNPEALDKFNPEQIEFLEKIAAQIYPIQDKKIFLNVVKFVGFSLLLSIILGSIMIFVKDKPVDDFFIMIASVSIGALAGLLVPNPTNS